MFQSMSSTSKKVDMESMMAFNYNKAKQVFQNSQDIIILKHFLFSK
jgi:hypothetical protein